MAHKPESENNIKRVQYRQEVGSFAGGLTFRGKDGGIVALRTEEWRAKNDNSVTEDDFLELPYLHSNSPEDKSTKKSLQTAKRVLKQIKEGDLSDNRLGIEAEGCLYSKDGRRLLPKYDGGNFTAQNDKHPEMVASMIEVATEKLPDGRFPSYPVETANSLAKAINEGVMTADIRGGLFVVSSAPEGGDSSQITQTDHPYIKKWKPTPIEHVAWKNDIPQETWDIYKQARLKDIIPVHATHIHTSNPQLEDSKFLDQRAAYAKGILRLTQMEKVSNFTLFSTRDYLGKHIAGVKDVRALVRRGFIGAMDADIPENAHDFFEKARYSVANGEIHSFSRYPRSGQHDRLRIKEFGTVESVDGAANPDLRLVLAKTFFDQLKDVFAYKALIAVNGDESRVIPYLKETYGYLFDVIPTMKGKNSSFQQDLEFNKNGFEGKNDGKTFKEQMDDVRGLVRQIGNEFSILKTQARIVDHVFAKVTEPPQEELGLDRYLDIKSGMKSGIVTDNKYLNIVDNLQAQAEGTRKQAEALKNINSEKDLLEFFGIKDNLHQKVIFLAPVKR